MNSPAGKEWRNYFFSKSQIPPCIQACSQSAFWEDGAARAGSIVKLAELGGPFAVCP